MTYTFTEKKRIRKSFAKRETVLDIPFLLTTQLESYREFLQEGVSFSDRKEVGLQAAFASVFPITSANGYARLEFGHYVLQDPPFDVAECQLRGITYAAPLRARIKLVILDKESSKPVVKEVRENEVYMGEIPLMTDNGSFVINGTERVTSIHRNAGGQTHNPHDLPIIQPAQYKLATTRVTSVGRKLPVREPSISPCKLRSIRMA